MNKNNVTKQVNLSQILEDLTSGLTKWKKDDIGFGSLEKKYQLTFDEMVSLTSHPKVKMMETKVPTFVINDDLPTHDIVQETSIECPVTPQVVEAKIAVEQPRAKIQNEKPVVTQVETTSYERPTSLATFI